MQDKSTIHNPERAGQLKDFSGLRFGSILPTDIDACIEYHDKLWVFIEFKYGPAMMLPGQRLAFQRLCADMGKVKPTLGIIASHWQYQSEQIDCGGARVVEICWLGNFTEPTGDFTVREIIEGFLRKIDSTKGGWNGQGKKG